MPKPFVIMLSVAVYFTAVAFALIGSYISAYNLGNRSEQSIEAAWTNNQNVLSQYHLKIKEAAQVPGMQRDDLLAIFSGANESRYGADGSTATFQWLKEQNPNLDQETYKQLQRMMEAGRNEFRTEQTRLIDAKRSYKTNLGSFWTGFWLSASGYPKVDLEKFGIITTKSTKDAFDTGTEEALQLR